MRDRPLTAILYLRQSLDKHGDELGVARQEAECRRLCEQRGYEVTEVITDNSVSATTGTREGYKRVLQMIERQAVDVVVVLRIDRLLRRLTELEALIELCERTGVVVATVHGDIDLSSSSGRLVGRILASVARSEVEVKSERHKAANKQRAEAGKPHGSRRPYGYEADMLTVRESEAVVLRAMADRVMAGVPYKEVAYWANEQGYTTTFGKPWYSITVRNLLRKPRYGGYREYLGTLYPAQWPAIFTPQQYTRLHAVMDGRAEASDTPKARKYLLTGLVYCHECGLPLNGSARTERGHRRRTYICRMQGDTKRERGCGKVRRNADALDHFVRECVIARLDSPHMMALLNPDDAAATVEHVDNRLKWTAKLDELVADYANGLLTRAQFAAAKSVVELRIKEADTALRRLQSPVVDVKAGETIRQAWERNGDGWRRSLIAHLVERIEVKAGNKKPYYYADGVRMRFAPELVVIKWRV